MVFIILEIEILRSVQNSAPFSLSKLKKSKSAVWAALRLHLLSVEIIFDAIFGTKENFRKPRFRRGENRDGTCVQDVCLNERHSESSL